MATLLHIKSSIFSNEGKSNQLAEVLVEQWKLTNPDGRVIVRDLITENIPHLDSETMGAFATAEDERSLAQHTIIERSDLLIEELRLADEVVMGVPMYNFGVPSQMKAYFDLLARSGVTFKYTENGAVGLLEEKPIYLVATRGGLYSDQGDDVHISFVKQFLRFIGLTDVQVINAEGLSLSSVVETSLQGAHQQINKLFSAVSR